MKTRSTNSAAKSILFILFFSILSIKVKAQDTLFYEGFNDWPVYMSNIDSVFKNFDEDAIPDANDFPGGWTVGNFANGGADQNEIVAMSSSWLQGAVNGNRNYLRLPGVYISDAYSLLKWRSAPALGNLYMDGYTVLVSTDSMTYENFPAANVDTLMHFAQNIGNDENQFSNGIKHSSFDSAAPISPTGVTQYPGLLMNWEASLSAYAGKKIYIIFLHDSDDDNYIALDDILVKGTVGAEPIGINNNSLTNAQPSFSVQPNPCKNSIELVSNLIASENTQAFVYNSVGQLIKTESVTGFKTRMDVSGFSSGIYYVNIHSGSKQFSVKFIKE